MFGKFFRFLDNRKQVDRASTSNTPPDTKRADLRRSPQIEPDVAITLMDPPSEAGKWYVLSTRGDRIYKVDLDSVTRYAQKLVTAVIRRRFEVA